MQVQIPDRLKFSVVFIQMINLKHETPPDRQSYTDSQTKFPSTCSLWFFRSLRLLLPLQQYPTHRSSAGSGTVPDTVRLPYPYAYTNMYFHSCCLAITRCRHHQNKKSAGTAVVFTFPVYRYGFTCFYIRIYHDGIIRHADKIREIIGRVVCYASPCFCCVSTRPLVSMLPHPLAVPAANR